MNYNKPAVISTRNASLAIMGIAKQSIMNEVDQPSPGPAYEADE